MPERPDLILFDIGSVIIDVDHREIASRLAATSEDPRYTNPTAMLDALISHNAAVINDYDTGRISSEDFYTTLAAALQLNMDFPAFRDAWNACFRENALRIVPRRPTERDVPPVPPFEYQRHALPISSGDLSGHQKREHRHSVL